MNYRLAVALASLLVTFNAFASIVYVPSAIIVCPDASYVAGHVKHVNNFELAEAYGPTPAGTGDPNKCGITPVRGATPICPAGWQSHFAYDVKDFFNAPNPPVYRTFRQELHVSSFNGIPVGERLKFAEVKFTNGETVSFYFDRSYSWYTDLTVGYAACDSGCVEEEVGRHNFPTGLPIDQAVPLSIGWSTGRYGYYGNHPEVSWSIANAPPYNPSNSGTAYLSNLWARESLFSNGIIRNSCGGTDATVVRFIRPRFDN